MFDAQLLIAGSAVYSPWFARGGDNAIFTLDVIEFMLSGGTPTLSVTLFTKNSEDIGDGDVISGSSIDATSAGRESLEIDSALSTGLKELVRYKFAATANEGSALFRMLTPVWFDEVSA